MKSNFLLFNFGSALNEQNYDFGCFYQNLPVVFEECTMQRFLDSFFFSFLFPKTINRVVWCEAAATSRSRINLLSFFQNKITAMYQNRFGIRIRF